MKMYRRTAVGLKLLMLFVAACTFLISPVSALAQQTERDSILNNGVSHVASWAYYTDPSSARWYISQITAGKIDVYSLGPIVNHNAGWWTVGNSAAFVGLSDLTISVDSNLDWNPLDTFYDIGLREWLSDSRIHSDRQRIQGTHVPIKWFFFNAPNGSWYILKASGYRSNPEILRFAESNGQYDWKKTDTTDFAPVFSNSSNGGIHVSFYSKLDAFIKKWTGIRIEYADPSNLYQCMDLMFEYNDEVLGIVGFGAPTAYEAYLKGDSRFDKIPNTGTNLPQKGDLVFWRQTDDNWVNKAGHVAMFIEGDRTRFSSFDQNWPAGSPSEVVEHWKWEWVAGWLHPK